MRWAEYFDLDTIRETIHVLKPNNALFEIRSIVKGKRKTVVSGYFTDADMLIQKLKDDKLDPRGANIYITINKINDDCYAREQHDCFKQTDATTSDHEIDAYEWFFIDMDPIRLSEISSSNKELKHAQEVSNKVYEYLKGIGFNEPIRAMSGNGYHLLYKINLPNTEEVKQIIERCLSVLADMFNTEDVKIDTVNYNQSRICKLYGTLAQKGANTPSRPHRMSKLISVPDEIEVNGIELLESLAGELPKVEPKKDKIRSSSSGSTTSSSEFDLESWMYEHGLEPIRKDAGNDCVIYPLANCPFDSSHTNGDSKIFHYSNGAIAFKCHHNSCRGRQWQDVREKLEPGAYDKARENEENDARIEAGYQKIKQQFMQQYATVHYADEEEVRKQLPKLKAISAEELQKMEFAERYYAVEDMIPQGETVIGAPPKTGKSWLMLDMCLKIAKGEEFLGFQTRQSDTLYLALEDGDSFEQERLNIVTGGEVAPKNFHFVFTDVMPMNEGFLLQLDDLITQYPEIKVVVIDTLQFIKYRQGKSESAYECDYRTGRDLKKYAEKHDLAIVVVTHTTKMSHPEDDMANISGTNGVTGAADSVIVLTKDHRTDTNARMFISGRKVRQSVHNIDFDDKSCQWQYMGVAEITNKDLREMADKEMAYMNSNIRAAVLEIASKHDGEFWSGRAGALIEEAVKYGIGIKEDNKAVGGFLNKMQGLFMDMDGVQIEKIKNGTGPYIYKIYSLKTHQNPFDLE